MILKMQVLIAALDLHRLEDAQMELTKLQKNFPGSLRVKGLEGMLHEARAGVFGSANPTVAQNAGHSSRQAARCYNEILKEDPCNTFAMKRKVVFFELFNVLQNYASKTDSTGQICMSKALGTQEGMNEAIKSLNEYLLLFPTDVEAWREMADIYLDLQQVDQAKFALEEVVMLSPINYVSHLKLAEALYTLGDYSTARKFVCSHDACCSRALAVF